MSVPISEQETTISFSRGSSEARIWTSDTTVMTRLDKLVKSSPNYGLLDEGRSKGGGVLYRVYTVSDKALVSFRARRVKLELTDEQRAERGLRLKPQENLGGVDVDRSSNT